MLYTNSSLAACCQASLFALPEAKKGLLGCSAGLNWSSALLTRCIMPSMSARGCRIAAGPSAAAGPRLEGARAQPRACAGLQLHRSNGTERAMQGSRILARPRPLPLRRPQRRRSAATPPLQAALYSLPVSAHGWHRWCFDLVPESTAESGALAVVAPSVGSPTCRWPALSLPAPLLTPSHTSLPFGRRPTCTAACRRGAASPSCEHRGRAPCTCCTPSRPEFADGNRGAAFLAAQDFCWELSCITASTASCGRIMRCQGAR